MPGKFLGIVSQGPSDSKTMSGENRLSSRNNQLKLKTSGTLPIIREESIEYTNIPQMKKVNPDDVNMQPVGFRVTRIFTDFAQKLPVLSPIGYKLTSSGLMLSFI